MEKTSAKKQRTDFAFFLNRLLHPRHWSLRTRLVYTTGAILFTGALLTLGSIFYTLDTSAKDSIHHILDDYEHLFRQQLEKQLEVNLSIAAQLASFPEILRAMDSGSDIFLSNSVNTIATNLMRLGQPLPPTQFFSTESTPVFNTLSGNKLADIHRNDFKLIELVEKEQQPLQGVQILYNGPVLSAVVPTFFEKKLVGSIEISTSFEKLFKSLNRSSGYGMSVLIEKKLAKQFLKTKKYKTTENFLIFHNFGTTKIEEVDVTNTSLPYNQTGSYFSKTIPLTDHQNQGFGKVILFYDGSVILDKARSTIIIISCMTLVGVAVLSFSLYWNANRIRRFFKQMRKILIASHFNDFSEGFDISTVHCLEVLQCGHKECPIYKDPTRICYLETGDEAISPKWRASCVFLNKYEKCVNCPVYKMHHGDEITEMQHVINTMMRLWGDFLGSVGKLLSDVFREDSRNMPSLDGVSGYLSQIADLTKYSHDLQGVYNDEEVYRQLQWIFETKFNFGHFTLLQVNPSENKMEPVINKIDLSESHLDVFFDCQLCRCMRVAEDIISFNNPHICPYFGINTQTHVRCCLPMVMGGRVGAVFTFVVEKQEWGQRQHDISIIKKYLDETAPILSSLRLLQISKEQALKDPLTKCHNRRFMDEYLAQFERLNQRKQRKIGFIMADLDHFKMVNDEFGHLAGDDVLKQLAEIIRNTIRKSDVLIRYGGEEFLIMLMEIEQEGITVDVAEKIRVAVEEAKLSLSSGGFLKKTLSMGVAEYPQDGEQLYQVIKYADVALYQAKLQGRNRVLNFKPEMWETEEY